MSWEELHAHVEMHRRRRNEAEDMWMDVIENHRKGNTAEVTRLLNALTALDDLELMEAGLESWDDGHD